MNFVHDTKSVFFLNIVLLNVTKSRSLLFFFVSIWKFIRRKCWLMAYVYTIYAMLLCCMMVNAFLKHALYFFLLHIVSIWTIVYEFSNFILAKIIKCMSLFHGCICTFLATFFPSFVNVVVVALIYMYSVILKIARYLSI